MLIALFKGRCRGLVQQRHRDVTVLVQAPLQAKYPKQHCPALAPPVCTKPGFILEHAHMIRILIWSDLNEIRIAKQQLMSH
jgi:hypothetical protein